MASGHSKSPNLTADLRTILDDLERSDQDARRIAGGLSDAQANWQPGESAWSIAQCLDHNAQASDLEPGRSTLHRTCARGRQIFGRMQKLKALLRCALPRRQARLTHGQCATRALRTPTSSSPKPPVDKSLHMLIIRPCRGNPTTLAKPAPCLRPCWSRPERGGMAMICRRKPASNRARYIPCSCA